MSSKVLRQASKFTEAARRGAIGAAISKSYGLSSPVTDTCELTGQITIRQKRIASAYWDASNRVRHWVLTGCHVISGNHEESIGKPGVGSLTTANFGKADDATARDSSSCTSSSSSSASATIHLHGSDDDPLVPSDTEINRIFHTARRTWQRFVSLGASMPPGYMPRGTCSPSIMLKDVPPIPQHEATRWGGIEGVPVWRRRTGEDQGVETLVHGLSKSVSLLCRQPKSCRLALSTCPPPDPAHRGLGILILCWSYIISTRLLELQSRKARYSEHCLRPRVASEYVPGPAEYAVHLPSAASPDLIRWLCAILAHGPGWRATSFPVWAMFASSDVRFVILTDGRVSFDPNKPPPTAPQAAELLIEFCGLFALDGRRAGRGRTPGKGAVPFEELSPYTAAFLAALSLPTYGAQKLEPILTLFPLERKGPNGIRRVDAASIRQYVEDLPYYMTLSAETYGLQSTLWSMFWQPDIPCNLVSPWLAGVLCVLRPLIDARDATTVSKTFALRRPRVALWWTGLLLLGSPDIWQQMTLWLETTEGRHGRGLAALSYPDITVAAWTGSPNSFWELEGGVVTASYLQSADRIPRIDVLRCRFNHNLRDENSRFTTCWRPYSHIQKKDVELDIWPSLEQGFSREYAHWVWKNIEDREQLGFRRDTKRFVDTDEDLGLADAGEDEDNELGHMIILKRPTVIAVGQMLSCFMRDVYGSIAVANAALPGFETHKWQRQWNILPSSW
ncbi:hypothetical protein GE09DRAFT_1170471 [Coniochaeta sp. 2T2.1]|nr:hypothetical protein GE09DRAFT_1170471 [Coniochaeta sp. 2T2.1]